MGYVSWLTADTRESIPVVDSGHEQRTVYLLQPNGAPPIADAAYEGFTVFGGVSVFDWLVRHNASADRVDELLAHPWYGVQLSTGLRYFRDVDTGARFCVFHTGPNAVDPTIVAHRCTYADPLPGYGISANDLADQGRIVEEHLPVAVPLKFSFDAAARYEDLPASEDCPDQGCYYGNADDDDEDETVH